MQSKQVKFDLPSIFLILIMSCSCLATKLQKAKPHAQTSKAVTCDQEQYVGHMIVLGSFVLFLPDGTANDGSTNFKRHFLANFLWQMLKEKLKKLLTLFSLCIANLEPLGMESGRIADSQITASTQRHATCGACNARLNLVGCRDKAGAWSAGVCNSDQWLQVDLGLIREVTGIMTQGRQDANECVQSYTISYSDDGTTFTSYQQGKVCGLLK